MPTSLGKKGDAENMLMKTDTNNKTNGQPPTHPRNRTVRCHSATRTVKKPEKALSSHAPQRLPSNGQRLPEVGGAVRGGASEGLIQVVN